MISNFTDGLRYQEYNGAFPRFVSLLYYPNILLINTNGLIRKYIYLNGHIVGEQNPRFGNLVLNWPRMQKYRR